MHRDLSPPPAPMTPGLLIAAPASASGKTTVTLGLLRHLANRGVAVAPVKVGPDYIDPAFHAVASRRPCLNLDGWAMRPTTLAALAGQSARGAALIVGEGVMGLFDGAADGTGSTADLAVRTGWPVILVADAGGQAASAAATVFGFARFRPEVPVAGVVFNRIGGPRHAQILRTACAPLGIPVLGCLPKHPGLALPDRHLGLVQAGEHPDLERFTEEAATLVAEHIDVSALIALAAATRLPDPGPAQPLPPLGQRIAVARDLAFAFAYPAVLDGWARAGAAVTPFSPLADEPPPADADAVYLPGGYPELHAGRLAGNGRFLDGLRTAAAAGATVYGECGGYMVLGQGLVDGDGRRHAMAGLLPVETSFAARRLHIGYRRAVLAADTPLGRAGTAFRGHEFHFASILAGDGERPLFRAADASGSDLGTAGGRQGGVIGSFLHLIDRAEEP